MLSSVCITPRVFSQVFCLFVCLFVCLLACLFVYEMSEQQPELSDVDKVRCCFDGFENNN